jgi:hypothetical protein
MIAKRTKPVRKRRNVFAATLARFVDAKRGHPAQPSGSSKFPLFGRPAPAKAPDPVSLAVFAIDRVGPAAVRAAASGVECASSPPTRRQRPSSAPRCRKLPGIARPIA